MLMHCTLTDLLPVTAVLDRRTMNEPPLPSLAISLFQHVPSLENAQLGVIHEYLVP